MSTKGASFSVGNPLASSSGGGGSSAAKGGASAASGVSAAHIGGAATAAAGVAAGAGAYAMGAAGAVDGEAARNAAGEAGATVTNALQNAANNVDFDPALAQMGNAAEAAGDAAADGAVHASQAAAGSASYAAHAAAGSAQYAATAAEGAAGVVGGAASTGAAHAAKGGKALVRRASAAFAPDAGKRVAAAAGTGKQAVSSTLTAGVAAGTNFWESSMAAGQKLLDFTPPADMYSESRATLAYALASAAGAAVSLFSLVKLEVLRDFFQLLSLFIANVATTAMADAKLVFGNVSSIISLDWSFVIPSINPGVIYGIIFAVALILVLAYLWAMFQTRSLQMDEIREGKEVKTWDALAAVRGAHAVCGQHALNSF